MINVTGLPGQTAFDLALQYYGSVDGLRKLLEDNTINDEFIVVPETVTGQTIRIREDEVINKKVTDYYTKPGVSY